MKKWGSAFYTALIFYLCLMPGCSSSPSEFVDDFSDPASGWGAASHETYVRGYQQGEYLIQLDVPQWYVWATPGYSYEDVQVETSTRSAGQINNHFGLICRYDEQAFYYFAVSADGYYAIYKHELDGGLVPLTGDDMLFSPLIRQEGLENQMRIVCEGNRLSLYINEQLLAEIENDDLTKGDIGMATGTLKTGGTSVWFDDFKVSQP